MPWRDRLASFRKRTTHRRDLFLVFLTNHVVARVLFSAWRLWWYRHIMGFDIGPGASLLRDIRVSRRGNMRVGAHTVINNGCRLDNRFPIVIGKNVSLTYGTLVLTKGHDIDSPVFATKGAGVTIEDYAWICANAIILPGVRVGRGGVVLPGGVVVKDVEPFHVVGGNPVKFIRERSRDLRYQLRWDPWVPFFG
ncbi:MAG: acyltransferase [Elusimicrobia bacterium]|nr:acyltransferase [Elusimicrobiota bacterium]